jgi:hypothetical protein
MAMPPRWCIPIKRENGVAQRCGIGGNRSGRYGLALDRPRTVTDQTLPERLPAQLAQGFHGAFGDHHARAVHTTGVILQGRFEPRAEAPQLSMASLFTHRDPVVVRFIAERSVLCRVPTGNSMASCVIISERAAELIRKAHGL